jgi:hypothetical protein
MTERKTLTKHSGDCTIYSSLINNRPEDGICTCGYGLQQKRECDFSEIYSDELERKLEEENQTLGRKK